MDMPRKLAKVIKVKGISTIWIIPIVTILIGFWILFSHFASQAIEVTLLTKDASGIVAGKTKIKSRSVDVGVVEQVTLDSNYQQVVIKARIYNNMKGLLKKDSLFWVVKPAIGRDGITGLNTLLSGSYIELVVGSDNSHFKNEPFLLSDNPSHADHSIRGIKINLESDKNGVIPQGASVLFNGYKVGNVETSKFDVISRKMDYQIFITTPYDVLVTENVRFWKEGKVNLKLSPQGVDFNIPSLDVLLSGGISFGLPDGAELGKPATELTTYKLYENKNLIQDSEYMDYKEFLLMFDDSISGLSEGAPVEYHGMRLGTVSKVPFYTNEMLENTSILNQDIPVLVRIEPERLSRFIDKKIDIASLIIEEQKNGLRASLKTMNILTGGLYVDLDFYSDKKQKFNPKEMKRYGYNMIKTETTGIAQIQEKILQILNKLSDLPIDSTINKLNESLFSIQKMTDSLNQIISSQGMQNLPQELQKTLLNLNKTLGDFQSNSSLGGQLKESVQKIDMMMDQLTPLLDTLNSKSNALIFSSPPKTDPQPKAKGSK